MLQLSVIIPYYNAAPYIERCVVSLMEQTLSEGVEFLFVDDGSTDHSAEILTNTLSHYSYRLPQVSLLFTSRHSGVGSARALALAEAHGHYIAFCDADDWVELDAFQTIICHIAATNADVILSDFTISDATGSHLVSYPDQTLTHRLASGQWWMLWSHTVRRSLLLEHGLTTIEGIDYWEDMDLLMRIYHFAQSVSYIHRPLYHYDCTPSQSLTRGYSGLLLLPKCQQVIDHLTAFYHDQHAEPPVRLLALKQSARDLYLRQSPVDWQAWRRLYPESWRYVWCDAQFRFSYRVVYTLASWGWTSLLRLYRYLSKVQNRS